MLQYIVYSSHLQEYHSDITDISFMQEMQV